MDQRAAGLLLHLCSLPSETGIGNLGAGGMAVIDFLADAGFGIWQMCPLGPTGYGDSPYQSFSAFAGNPYFIDLEPLLGAGLLRAEELSPLPALPKDRVDYGALYERFWPVLSKAFDRFKAAGADSVADYGSLREFHSAQAHWLDDYALFMALKAKNGGRCWLDWPTGERDARKARVHLSDHGQLGRDTAAQVFYQYLFYGQLAKLRAYAATRGVQIMGDIPIFVALDSADTWANQSLFQLDSCGQPKAVAGVPPDYFSADGQLWGNPLFAWEAHRADGFRWWLQRIRSTLEFFDIVRIDHFRGFEAYWSVPANASTAKNGRWIPAPGMELFEAVQRALPDAKIVAEDLGVITNKVRKLLSRTGLPGMAVLQFAFGGDEENDYLPHRVGGNTVIYTGTHDNDTTRGWYATLSEAEQSFVRTYLSVSGEDIAWDFTRAAFESAARLAVVPLQDLMDLGSEARLNRPGSTQGNWQWRFTQDQMDALRTTKLALLKKLVIDSGR